LIVCLNWTGLSAVLKTFASFNDTETSAENIFSAGTLDFSLRSGQTNFTPLETALNMKPGDSVARDIYIKKDGSLPFKYNAHAEPATTCDPILYNALQLKISYNYYTDTPTEPNYHEHRTMALKYDGLLKDFNDFDTNPDDPDLQIPNSHLYFDNIFYGPDEHWFYATEVILPTNVSAELQNKTCQFKFVFDGWQTDLSDSSSGFTDQEEILNTIATGNWMPNVEVIYPNGGETWYIVPGGSGWSAWCQAHGMNADCQYPIKWTATNPIGPDTDLLIDIYYSVDSGNTWMTQQVANDTENDGVYWWKVPYDMSYVTEEGRIKVVATHKDYSFLTAWDMSDTDFCPPLLTLEDLLNWEESLVEEEPINEEELIPEELVEEAVDEVVEKEPEETIEEEVTAEENQEEEGIIEEINETIDEVIDEIVDEIMLAGETGDEVISEPEAPIIEDVPIIEEASTDETPAVEEQPAAMPDDGSSNSDGAGESVSDGESISDEGSDDESCDTSGGLDSSSPAEGGGKTGEVGI